MKKPKAVFTIVHSEKYFMPIWIKYYEKYFDNSDIYVLDHNSDDISLEFLLEGTRFGRFTRIPVHRFEIFNHNWLRETVMSFQKFLLQSYDTVLFTEIDEIIAPRTGNLSEFIANMDKDVYRVTGFNIWHDYKNEPAIDVRKPLMPQRKYWMESEGSNKPLLSKKPLEYHVGFHSCVGGEEYPCDPELLMVHLHYLNFEWIYERDNSRPLAKWSKEDVRRGDGWYNQPKTRTQLQEFYDVHFVRQEMHLIPEELKHII